MSCIPCEILPDFLLIFKKLSDSIKNGTLGFKQGQITSKESDVM